MTTSDPIADMLARLRNALMVKHATVPMPSSKIKVAIAKILKEEGYISDYRVTSDERSFQTLVLELKYVGDTKHQRAVITELKRVSKPGRRIYTSVQDIPWVRSGMGIAVLSTPKGVITGQQARRLNVGGEVLCYVW
ncbi:MAG: 30S ribosomal protein S8 [Anaerolineae bacterium]|jgi:small subunit ribosomal protein S8|nr:30S ribosomal protein S8 [Anaerolineae bacterium]